MRDKTVRYRNRTRGQAILVALAGFGYAWRTQPNMRIHVGMALLVMALGRWLGLDTLHLSVLLLTAGTVIGAEWFNTAMERMVDLATREWHPLARLAKDLAASAVLWFALVAVGVGLLIFIPVLHRFPEALLPLTPLRAGEMVLVLAISFTCMLSGLRK